MSSQLPEVARGFLPWLEPESLHYHQGVVQVRALWGTMMQRAGGAEVSGWSAYALNPEGNILEADLAPGEGNFYKVAFFAGEEGLYQLVLENNAGIYLIPPGEGPEGQAGNKAVRYFQRARLPVPVGHHVHGSAGNACTMGLDIVCREYREYHPGDSAKIMVYFNGRPLPGVEVRSSYHLYTGGEYPWRGKTGEDGSLVFEFSAKGHWLFTCNHTTPGGEKDGGFDRTVHTASFVVAGVR